ncbi:hypothetical protein EPO05_06370 [Patescibacteria group bacterium]|nr:MAG: hypothetical protein EPO05_06370 [Patescibacteria group bacterium]
MVAKQLQALSIVETAYAAPEVAPAPSSPNYQSYQTYLNAAPSGVNAGYAKTFPGGAGDKAKVIDIEYSWNTNHEDLSKARTALIPNGTPVDPLSDTDHGTAVLGEMVADDNGYGVTGITPKANLGLVNAYNTNGYKIVEALYTAAFYTQPGDVILVEQQTLVHPTPDTMAQVPIEWVPAVYDMIKALTDGGRIVVEPAGNGNQNLDNTALFGASFPNGKVDSGALIVGAGLNCAGDVLRSRQSDSNYGSRINLQGPGNCVATTGYDPLWLTNDINARYTTGFSETSAAAPVVASAAVSLSSAYRTLNSGANITPALVRSILTSTATAQNSTSSGALTGNIGPLPDLAKALLKTDTKAPTAPAGVKVVLNSNHKPVVSWSASTDNNKIASYKLYRNGSSYKTVTGLSYTDTSVTVGKTYKYTLYAVDPSGNKSVVSTAVSIVVK